MDREIPFYLAVILFGAIALAYWAGIKCDSSSAGAAINRAAGLLPHALPNSINFSWANPRTGYPAGTLPARPDAQVLPTNSAT